MHSMDNVHVMHIIMHITMHMFMHMCMHIMHIIMQPFWLKHPSLLLSLLAAPHHGAGERAACWGLRTCWTT